MINIASFTSLRKKCLHYQCKETTVSLTKVDFAKSAKFTTVEVNLTSKSDSTCWKTLVTLKNE